jgi:pimeloyl-ACP methyl ester carboxylesterase
MMRPLQVRGGKGLAGMRWHKQTVMSGGVRLAVRDSGGDGTPAVLLHGLGAPQRSWDRVAPLLAPHLRVVTYDQRGHGASAAAADYSLAAFLADLQAVLDGLALEQQLLVGHSFGGLLAVEHVGTRPGCAGVVGVDGGLKIERPPIGWEEVQTQLNRPVTRLLSRAVTAVGMGTRLSMAELRRITDEAAEREAHLEEAYARLSCPLLVVLAAKADPVPHGEAMLAAVETAATRLQQRHPQVKLARLPCGHNIPLERPRELAHLIIRFAASSAVQL